MQEKTIIINKTDYPLSRCLTYVANVVVMGRVSDDGKSYCYVTKFTDGTYVYANRNKSSDTFTIFKE